ncbi:hypothetical protein HHK36_014821 [Tetracentron sinense]|uniref:Uncharacterized protein n=1 Tax=Tetracentron sinense TaxID=13715 RepID=A0A835DD95_TETSI|nr:hypothetical protein HHK36_014821 [Tetracentron sinense]
MIMFMQPVNLRIPVTVAAAVALAIVKMNWEMNVEVLLTLSVAHLLSTPSVISRSSAMPWPYAKDFPQGTAFR